MKKLEGEFQMGKTIRYEISSDDGKRFCDCEINGNHVKLCGKQGTVYIENLIAQIENRTRGRKPGKYRAATY